MEKLRVLFSSVIVVCMLFLSQPADAQVFIGGVQMGAVTSQIDGDQTTGFHKFGGMGGLFVEFPLHKHFHALELNFSQKGANAVAVDAKYTLGYVDVNYLFELKLSRFTSSLPDFVRLKLGAAASFKAYENFVVNDLKTSTDEFGKIDAQAIFGVDCMIGKHFCVDVRANYSFMPIEGQYYNFALMGILRYYIKTNAR